MSTLSEPIILEAMVCDVNRLRRAKRQQFKRWRTRHLPALRTLTCKLDKETYGLGPNRTTSLSSSQGVALVIYTIRFRATWSVRQHTSWADSKMHWMVTDSKFALIGSLLKLTHFDGGWINNFTPLDLQTPGADPTRYLVKCALSHCLNLQAAITHDWDPESCRFERQSKRFDDPL